MRRAGALAALLVLGALLALPSPAAAQEEVTILVFGPEVIAVSANVTYNVTVTGGPGADGGTFNVTSFLDGGPLLAGALPSRTDPDEQESTRNTYTVNVTAPGTPQSMELVVNVSSESADGSERSWGQISYPIVVVRPVTITALVTNPLNMSLEGVAVRFFVDGDFVGSVLEDLPALESKTVQFEWVVRSVAPGSHTATVEVDLDGDGVTDPAKGEVVAARIFYKTAEGPNYAGPTVFLLIVLAALVAIFLVRRSLRPK